MPDIDSLPPSYSPSRVHGNSSGERHSPSPRASNASLAAAASINAGIQHGESRRSSIASNRGRPSPQIGHVERRRSNAFLNSFDPALPGPGELQSTDRSSTNLAYRTASPQGGHGSPIMAPRFRDRAPSLGELHQELEQEQEAQVNRLLEMIRQQQAQLQALQQQTQQTPTTSSATADDTTPPSERSSSYPYPAAPSPQRALVGSGLGNPRPRSPTSRTPVELSRQSSRRSRATSRTSSPFRPTSAGLQPQADAWLGERSAILDDAAFYQAETQNLTRENQMLRHRIRELERQLSEGNSTATSSPPVASNLASAAPVEAETIEPSLPALGNSAMEPDGKEA
ncbi:hypothetical protein MMC21_006081 [Puttea exsequens]|nr:hypothetical protein [Puttea exsequens]